MATRRCFGFSTSTSTCIPLAYNLHHTMRIEHYDRLVDVVPSGYVVRGPHFGTGAYDSTVGFYVNIYPNGSRHIFSNWLSVFTHMTSVNGNNVIAHRICRLTYSLIDQYTSTHHFERTAHHTFAVGSMNYSSSNWGFRRFVDRADIAPLIAADGSLLVHISLDVCGSSDDLQITDNIDLSSLPLTSSNVVAAFLQNGHRTDFTLIAVDATSGRRQHLQTHRLVLAAHSIFFRNLFDRTDDDDCNEFNSIEIDASIVSVRILRDLLYTSSASFYQHLIIDSCAGTESIIDVAMQTLILLDKYLIDTIKKQFEMIASDMISIENVCDVVRLIDASIAPIVWRRCADVIWRNWNRLYDNGKWRRLHNEHPDRVLAMLNYTITIHMQQL